VFFLVGQWSGVDDVNGFVWVEDVDHLKEPATSAASPNEVLVFRVPKRVGALRLTDDPFGLFWIDPVPGNVIEVPIIPAKLHIQNPEISTL
jgi:hypothetical protein